MKYKVGDKVRVRSDLEIDSCYDVCMFSGNMRPFRGKEVIIEKVEEERRRYRIKGSSYAWTDAMFEQTPNIIINNELAITMKEYGDKILNIITPFIKQEVKQEFSWEEFKDRKFVINCNSEINIINFMKECDRQGIKFTLGDDASLVDWYNNRIKYQYDDEICFLVNNSQFGGLCHSEKEFFISEGYKVIEYSDIPHAKTLDEYSEIELIEELQRRYK